MPFVQRVTHIVEPFDDSPVTALSTMRCPTLALHTTFDPSQTTLIQLSPVAGDHHHGYRRISGSR